MSIATIDGGVLIGRSTRALPNGHSSEGGKLPVAQRRRESGLCQARLDPDPDRRRSADTAWGSRMFDVVSTGCQLRGWAVLPIGPIRPPFAPRSRTG